MKQSHQKALEILATMGYKKAHIDFLVDGSISKTIHAVTGKSVAIDGLNLIIDDTTYPIPEDLSYAT